MLAGYVDGNLAENELGRKRRGGGRILNFEGKMGRWVGRIGLGPPTLALEDEARWNRD